MGEKDCQPLAFIRNHDPPCRVEPDAPRSFGVGNAMGEDRFDGVRLGRVRRRFDAHDSARPVEKKQTVFNAKEINVGIFPAIGC